MPAAAYATPSDLGDYLRDVSVPQNSKVFSLLLNVASRFIDQKTGQYFFSDGQSTKFFDGEGLSQIDTRRHPFYAKTGTIAACAAGATSLTYTPMEGPAPANGDVFTIDVATTQEQVTVSNVTGSAPGPYTLTVTPTLYQHAATTSATTIVIKLAYFENQPPANWTTVLSGNGITPPSNFFLWPRNRPTAGSSADPTSKWPYYGIDIAHIPISATTFLPSSIPGYMTIQVTANWGWPVVPDLIKDLTLKLAARLWKAREAGWTEQLGGHDIGVVQVMQHFDPIDEFTLMASDLMNTQL